MQAYAYIRLRCILRDLLIGFFLAIVSISIIVPIVREMREAYLTSSANAYIAGLGISIVMLLTGLLAIWHAFSFEHSLFGKERDVRERFLQDLQEGQTVSAGTVLATEHFILAALPSSIKGCSLIRTADLTACFEKEQEQEKQEMQELQLTFVDDSFRSFEMVLEDEQARKGHEIAAALHGRMPWIFTADPGTFFERSASKSGRRRILQELGHRRDDAMQPFDEEQDEGGVRLLEASEEGPQKGEDPGSQ